MRYDNPAAIALYEKIGFRPFGRYPGYYEDGGGGAALREAAGAGLRRTPREAGGVRRQLFAPAARRRDLRRAFDRRMVSPSARRANSNRGRRDGCSPIARRGSRPAYDRFKSRPSVAPRRRLLGDAMNGWVILVDHLRDFPNAETPHKVITTSDYLARPKLFSTGGRAKIVNLSRSYNYQSKGYYASLLAEARGHRIIPTVETMLELREHKLYEYAAARPAGSAQSRRASRPRRRDDDLRSAVLLRPQPGSALRGVRPAVVRLVPLPGARGDDHAGQALEDRPPARAAARQARPRGGGVLPRRAAPPHRARLAQSARARRREIFARRALRSRRGAAALLGRNRSAISRSSPSSSRSTSNC